MSQTAPAPESEEMQKTLLRLAWECDFNTFQEAFEQASPQPDLEWRGTLPELYDRDNLYRRPFKTPMRAVDIACLRGHWETAFYLLERGADWQYTNEHGTTLLHFVLLSRCNKDCRCYHQCPSPDLRSKILNRLLENDDIRGIINSRTQDLDLLHACDFRLALACGTNGASAIEIAAAGYGNDQETPRLLIDKGAIRAGLAHLMIKTRYPDVKMVEEYLKAEAPLTHSIGDHRNGEELDEDGNTILHSTVFRASMHGEMDIFALLELMLDMGFRPCKNNRGETVWDIACTKERPYLLGLLSERELRDEEGQFEDMDSWPQPNYEYVTSYLPLGQWSPHIQNEERIVASIIENNMINVLGSAMRLATVRMYGATTLEGRNRIAETIDKHFVENQGSDDHLVSREVGVRFEKLSVQEGNIDIRFASIALPFLWVEKTLDRAISGAEVFSYVGFCSTSNHSSLRICFPQTLDEHANLGINRKILDSRNKDQVLARYSIRSNDELGQVVMTVPQAWIWRIGEDLIVAIPWLQNHIGYTKDFGSKYILNPLLKISGVSTDHIIGLLLTELITSLDRPNIAGYYEPILTVFAKEIATISVNVDEYIRDSNIGNITVEMEKGFVHDISDIREELSMMNRVLSQQEEIWREFALDAWPDAENWPEGVNGRFILKKDRTSAHHRDAPGDTTSSESDNLNDRKIAEIRRQIEKPQYVIAKFKRRIADLDEDAERVEKSIQIRLDLVQKHLALRETRSMSVMSASVFAFTIITIIFTPLSFATSLFALSVDEFARHQITIPDREDPVYGTGYIVASLLSIEISALIITVVAILASLKYFLRMDIKQILEEIWKGFKQEREPAGTSEDSPVSGEQTPSRKSVQESGQADETAASVPTKKPLHRRLQSFGPKDWARGLRRRRNSDREPGYEMTEPGSRQ